MYFRLEAMGDAPVRQLNHDTAAGVLARIKRAEHVKITERGRMIARIIAASNNPLSTMISTGKLHPPMLSGLAPCTTGPVNTDHKAGQRETRETERY
jgi:antitoxin (DNA-binding transcriptional repressor) of toxin-antitoxin stability system